MVRMSPATRHLTLSTLSVASVPTAALVDRWIACLATPLPTCRSPTNREGWIPLVMAENKLGNDAVLQRMALVPPAPAWVMNYGSMKGAPGLQAALAALMNHTFIKVPLLPENICISSGCSAILDNLFFCISDAGSSVLIPAPYYPAFDNDLTAKCDLHCLPFFLEEHGDVAAQLDAEAAAAAVRGQPVSAVLLTNPNNPLGTIYSEESVAAMVAWCLRNKVHYVRWVGAVHSLAATIVASAARHCLSVWSRLCRVAEFVCMVDAALGSHACTRNSQLQGACPVQMALVFWTTTPHKCPLQ